MKTPNSRFEPTNAALRPKRSPSQKLNAIGPGIGEFSVYVARDSRGRGVGRRVLEALIEASAAAGLHKLVSRIFPENVASRAACRSVGFREVGIYKAHGQLEGVWKDCVIVERIVGS